ncbi:MAG TPA: YciI family protein [Solirubrobacteraceae bacterium]|nr:YciI family protein [Solirubrobacteraceae bacterium]
MKYLQLICIEGETGTPEAAAAMRENVGPWVQETVARHINIVGKPLDDPASAKTVRLRNGETIVSDGPFADTKEFIGGLDLLDCANLDEAIEVASKHPVSWFHAIELRPFPDGVEIPAIAAEDLRFLLQVFADDVPEAPEVQDALEGERWREEAGGALVFGNGLLPREAATTVRVRDGQILLTDGPFIETKEFLAGICLLSCEREQQAIELAARFPSARHHVVEVRRFVDL